MPSAVALGTESSPIQIVGDGFQGFAVGEQLSCGDRRILAVFGGLWAPDVFLVHDLQHKFEAAVKQVMGTASSWVPFRVLPLRFRKRRRTAYWDTGP